MANELAIDAENDGYGDAGSGGNADNDSCENGNVVNIEGINGEHVVNAVGNDVTKKTATRSNDCNDGDNVNNDDDGATRGRRKCVCVVLGGCLFVCIVWCFRSFLYACVCMISRACLFSVWSCMEKRKRGKRKTLCHPQCVYMCQKY